MGAVAFLKDQVVMMRIEVMRLRTLTSHFHVLARMGADTAETSYCEEGYLIKTNIAEA